MFPELTSVVIFGCRENAKLQTELELLSVLRVAKRCKPVATLVILLKIN